tara:strand:- start:366 stop:794 length:429 start_codon:yes stop_codon:yes gene_type:complete
MTSTNPKKKTKQAIPGLPKIDKRVVSIEGDQKLSQASIQSLLEQHHKMREQIKAFDEEIKKPYEKLSKQIANYMVSSNMQAKEKLDCIKNGYAVQLKARAKWTYSLETKRMALDLKTEQQLEQDTGVATNDPTFYISPVDPE